MSLTALTHGNTELIPLNRKGDSVSISLTEAAFLITHDSSGKASSIRQESNHLFQLLMSILLTGLIAIKFLPTKGKDESSLRKKIIKCFKIIPKRTIWGQLRNDITWNHGTAVPEAD